MRDWLDVGTLKLWTVYGLTDPTMDNHVFYVGITKNEIEARVSQHRSAKKSAARPVIMQIEALGEKVGFCIFAQNCTEGAALNLESTLAISLPQIVNRTHQHEGRGFWKPYPNIRFW